MQTDTPLTALTCSIGLRFPSQEVGRGLQLLLSSVGCTESKPGCQACSVARDEVDATLIHYRETWDSAEVFQRHARSEEFRRVLVALDMCYEEPEVVIGNFSGCVGLAYLQQICTQPEAGETEP